MGRSAGIGLPAIGWPASASLSEAYEISDASSPYIESLERRASGL